MKSKVVSVVGTTKGVSPFCISWEGKYSGRHFKLEVHREPRNVDH